MATTVEYVSRVIDGDTFTGDSNKPNVRLKDVNAPELHEPNGVRAKQYLEGLIGRKHVTINTTGTGPYGRRIALVSVDGVDVNQAMRDYLRGL